MSKYKLGQKLRYTGGTCSVVIGTLCEVTGTDQHGVNYRTLEGKSHDCYEPDSSFRPVDDIELVQSGDLIDCGEGDTKKVIDVLPHSALLSELYNHDEVDNFWSFNEMRSKGWTVKGAEPDVTELSVAEIEERLGVTAGTLRVKKDD